MNETTVADWRGLLDGAHRALRDAVAGVGAGDWDRPTPCDQWTVTQVLQHAAGDQIGYAAAITGGPWPSFDPFKPSGELDGDAGEFLAQAVAASAAAFATVADDAPEVPTPLPQGAMPAWLAAGACALDAAVHAWDIAVATGQASPLTPRMSAELMLVATRIVEPLRQWGAYAAVVEGEPADETVTLLRYLGRRP